MDTEVLTDKKKVLYNEKLVVAGKEFMTNELNDKNFPHAYYVEKFNWDNDVPQIHQINPMLEEGNKFITYSAKIQSVSQAKLVPYAVAANQASNLSVHLAYSYRI